MTIELTVHSADAESDLIALAQRLRGERELAGLVWQQRTPIVDNQLGGAWDTITVAMGSGGVGSVLAGALTTWLQHRTKTTVKLTRGDLSVEIHTGRIKDATALVDRLMVGTPDTDR